MTFMEEVVNNVWRMLTSRAGVGLFGGPVAWRFIFQPAAASFFAIRAGLKDAREGRPAFGWAVITGHRRRGELLREARDVGKVFAMAALIELIYQFKILRGFYPGQLLLVASILALLPYLLIRGPLNRIVTAWRRRGHSAGPILPHGRPHF
jgi:hypothetical protein